MSGQARVFVIDSQVHLDVLEELASIDPDLIWEARGEQILVIRGPKCPRGKALRAALKGARVLERLESIRQAFTAPPHWTNRGWVSDS